MTNFPTDLIKTVETVKTDTLGNTDRPQATNQEFLTTIFQDMPDDVRPILVGIEGQLDKATNKAWRGHSWRLDKEVWFDDANNYFSLAAFTADKEGRYSRRKANFAGLYCVMLDDIGSKVDSDKLTLEPTWLLETSTDNFQAGYAFSQPVADAAVADQLMNAIIEAELCDPGAGGPTARLARLPVGANGKYDPMFVCQLHQWHPHLRYTVDELVAGLGLTLAATRQSKKPSPAQAATGLAPSLYVPRPHTNPVLEALHAKGLYKASLPEGKHDITCPWVTEHTDNDDSGTAYFEPTLNFPKGGFKCHHGHCSHRHIADLLDFLGISPQVAGGKALIHVQPGELSSIVFAAEQVLAGAGIYYQRGSEIVTVQNDPGTRETRIKTLTSNELNLALSEHSNWMRYDQRKEAYTATDPSPKYSNALLDKTSYRHLPVLNGVARQPFMQRDGTLVVDAGYDETSQIYGDFDAQRWTIKDSPSRDDALAALAELRHLIAEFPFMEAHDEAAALAALLTASVRPSLPAAPLFHVKAHLPGSGKSYLCQLISAFATAQHPAPTNFPTDDEECTKILLAKLMNAPAVIDFDNMSTDLIPHNSLCTTLTSEQLSGRVLGASKTITVSTRTLFLSSGNNVAPVKDMGRRCVTMRLVPGCETPEQREFKNPDLLGHLRKHREYFVSAALTIIRAWFAEGCPITPSKSLASFGKWSEWCRQPLLWLDVADPVESVFRSLAEDPEKQQLENLMSAWFDLVGATPMRLRDLVTKARHAGAAGENLVHLLEDIAGDNKGAINNRKLGWWLKGNLGRRVDGKQLQKAGSKGSAEKWIVAPI